MQASFYFLLAVLTPEYRYHCTMYRSGLENQSNRQCAEQLTIEVLPYQAQVWRWMKRLLCPLEWSDTTPSWGESPVSHHPAWTFCMRHHFQLKRKQLVPATEHAAYRLRMTLAAPHLSYQQVHTWVWHRCTSINSPHKHIHSFLFLTNSSCYNPSFRKNPAAKQAESLFSEYLTEGRTDWDSVKSDSLSANSFKWWLFHHHPPSSSLCLQTRAKIHCKRMTKKKN